MIVTLTTPLVLSIDAMMKFSYFTALLPKMNKIELRYCFTNSHCLQMTFKSGYINVLREILPQNLDVTEPFTSQDQGKTETLNCRDRNVQNMTRDRDYISAHMYDACIEASCTACNQYFLCLLL